MIESHCKSCGAPIYWAVTPTGKNMPLDVVSATLFLLDPEGAQDDSPRCKPVQVRASHFSTCKDAKEWRRG